MRKRRILSLLLAVAVMATMLVAVPLTASADVADAETIGATTNPCVEWDFLGSTGNVQLFKDSDYQSQESNPAVDIHYYIQPTTDKYNSADPTIEIYREGGTTPPALGEQGEFNKCNKTLVTLAGQTYNNNSDKKGAKASSAQKYDIDPNVPENNAANIYIAFAATSNANNGAKLSYSGSDSRISAKDDTTSDMVVWKLENIKNKITIKPSAEIYLYYIGMEYVLSDKRLERK